MSDRTWSGGTKEVLARELQKGDVITRFNRDWRVTLVNFDKDNELEKSKYRVAVDALGSEEGYTRPNMQFTFSYNQTCVLKAGF